MDLEMQTIFCLVSISIGPFSCSLFISIQMHLTSPWFCYSYLFNSVHKNFHCRKNIINVLFASLMEPTNYPLQILQTSKLLFLENHHVFRHLGWMCFLVCWEMDQSDFIGYQVEKHYIMPALLPLVCHERLCLPHSPHYHLSKHELVCNSLPVFELWHRSLYAARCHQNTNWNV